MGDEYWLETQASLQGEDPLFSKPKLAENLLKKPPFRFIHDIISAVSVVAPLVFPETQSPKPRATDLDVGSGSLHNHGKPEAHS